MNDDDDLFALLEADLAAMDDDPPAWCADLTPEEAVEVLREVLMEAQVSGVIRACELVRHRYTTPPFLDNRKLFAVDRYMRSRVQ